MPTPFFELISEITLPPWSAATTGWCMSETDPPCPNCKRDGFFNIPKVPLKLAYDEEPRSFSVAATYERFGKSRLKADFRKSLFANPCFVVDEPVRKVLSDERGVEFVPVAFS
jgi:hypothetical protein